MRRIRPLLIGIAIVAVYWGASLLRASMGIEWSATSIQTFVAGLGIKAPLIFFGLVAFRQIEFRKICGYAHVAEMLVSKTQAAA